MRAVRPCGGSCVRSAPGNPPAPGADLLRACRQAAAAAEANVALAVDSATTAAIARGDEFVTTARQQAQTATTAADTATDACRLTVVTTNRLPLGLRRAAWQVAIFDRDGVVRSLPVLDFGPLIAGKTKVAQFEIPGLGCAQIGRIVVNDVASCEAGDGADLRDACLSGLATQARGDIDFGL